MNELSTLSIPVQSPTLWESGPWLDEIDLKVPRFICVVTIRSQNSFQRSNLYHTSSVIATHIENITLPFRSVLYSCTLDLCDSSPRPYLAVHRMKGYQDTMLNTSTIISMRGNQKFAHLSGAFPLEPAAQSIEARLYDLSLNTFKSTGPVSIAWHL